MLNTNCKEVKEKIRAYLIENVNDLLELRKITTEKPFTEYKNIIESEKFYLESFSYSMFKTWLSGLGGFGDDVFLRWENEKRLCRSILEGWLEETEKESERYSNSDCEELMCRLCYREFNYLLKKENK